MSFARPKTVIEENDTVILYLTVQSLHAIDVLPYIKNKKDELVENVFQTSFGALKVKELIGVKYGSKVKGLFTNNVHDFDFLFHFFNFYISFFCSFSGSTVERMGICVATNTGTMDTNFAASNSNHLHAGHQYDSVSVGGEAGQCRH